MTNEIIYVTPKAYRLLYNYCALTLLDCEGLARKEKYRSLETEGRALEEGWKERRKELTDALAETGVSETIIHPIINSAFDYTAERVHELLRKVRIADSNAMQTDERVFVPDKVFRKIIEFISIRHFYYAIDDIADFFEDTNYSENTFITLLRKSEDKLRKMFEDANIDFDEFYDLFYEDDLLDDNRAHNIRKVLRKYYPESAREEVND